MCDIQKEIEKIVCTNTVVLFMKGTKDMPMCGFSNIVVQILKQLDIPFLAINVLDNPEIREGVKIFSDWPTIPQLYINGEFIGGCDIVRDMDESGELKDVFGQV